MDLRKKNGVDWQQFSNNPAKKPVALRSRRSVVPLVQDELAPNTLPSLTPRGQRPASPQAEHARPIVPAVHPAWSLSQNRYHAAGSDESYHCTTCKKIVLPLPLPTHRQTRLQAYGGAPMPSRHPFGQVEAGPLRLRPGTPRARASTAEADRPGGPLPAAPGRARREDGVAPRPQARGHQCNARCHGARLATWPAARRRLPGLATTADSYGRRQAGRPAFGR